MSAVRSGGNKRLFMRSDIRRLSFVMVAQRIGLTLAEIRDALGSLPLGRAPNQEDWTALSTGMREMLQERIDLLTRTRDLLDGCIGCGCLSLDRCALYNPADRAAAKGPGPRYLLSNVQDR